MEGCGECDFCIYSSNCCGLSEMTQCCCHGDRVHAWPYLCVITSKDSQCCCRGNEKKDHHHTSGHNHNRTADALTAFEPLVMGARVVVGTKSAPLSTSSDRRPRL